MGSVPWRVSYPRSVPTLRIRARIRRDPPRLRRGDRGRQLPRLCRKRPERRTLPFRHSRDRNRGRSEHRTRHSGRLSNLNGIAVDPYLRTSDAHSWAIGDCAHFSYTHAGAPTRLESVHNAVDHARALARTLSGTPTEYHQVPWFWIQQGPINSRSSASPANKMAPLSMATPRTESSPFSASAMAH